MGQGLTVTIVWASRIAGGQPCREPPKRRGPPPTPAEEPEPEEPLHAQRGEVDEPVEPPPKHAKGETPPSPRHRLRDRRQYWIATMHQLGVVCALTLSVLAGGFRMDWDPELGTAAPIHLLNHPSAFANKAFVSEAVATGIRAGTMRVCNREDLICVLPLGVAINSAGKLRLIWDGRHVNKHLRKRPFRMETLQREGRALFERSRYGGTVDISSAYHHIDMAACATPYLGFEWEGTFHCFDVLPFGLSSAPWLFTTVMGHSARFLRHTGTDLLVYLDDVVFGHADARGAVTSAQRMIHILQEFGWLIHPTKCVGTSVAAQTFSALGTLVNLLTQTYSVPPATVDRILSGITALLSGAPAAGVRSRVAVSVRAVSRVKGLITSTWVATGVATRVRTREMDRVIESRPTGRSRRERREGWNALVPLTEECLAELHWWLGNLHRINGCRICLHPLAGLFDSVIESDASDTGVGAVILVEGLAAASSSIVTALLAMAAGRFTRRHVLRSALKGIEFMAALPEHLLSASSTLRELYGIELFISAIAHLLRGGRHRVVMDNLGCVFIMGGVVPPFAVGGKEWGEFVSGGSPNPDLQRIATKLLDLQVTHEFTLVFVWVPRDQNVRADYLSHVSEMRHHLYSLRADWFAYLDGLWGPHTVDRFATLDNCQPLGAPNTGRFCSQYFHPSAEWVDAFTVPWTGENNWVFPPTHMVGEAVAHLRTSGAVGTVIVPDAPWAPWWGSLRLGAHWAPDVTGVVPLGAPSDVLTVACEDRKLFKQIHVMLAVRLDHRTRAIAGGDSISRAPP